MGTGVRLDVHSEAFREMPIEVPGYSDRPQELPHLRSRMIELEFICENEREKVSVELDHSHTHAYILGMIGRSFFLDPENDLRLGTCTLTVHSAVKIYNHT